MPGPAGLGKPRSGVTYIAGMTRIAMNSEEKFSRSLFEICQAMVSSLEIEEVLDTILELTMGNLQADSGSILLYEKGSDELRMLASKGLPPGVVKRGFVARRGSIAEQVIETNEPAIVNGRPGNWNGGSEHIKPADRIRSAICAPLRAKGQVIGTLNLNRYDGQTEPFGDRDVQKVMILASHAALCIENARLYQSNLEKTRLAAIGQTVAGISHCVKNMLTGLRGGVGLLELAASSQDWGSNGRGLSLLKRNVERISMLVMDMLDYSKDRKVPSRRDASVSLLVQEVFEVTEAKAREKGVELVRDIQPEAERVYVDADQIFRCLLNLVENAIDAAQSEGTRVTARSRLLEADEIASELGEDVDPATLGKTVCLSIVDTGPGIPEDALPSIFEIFFSTKQSKGTGLGLAVTRKIVEEHGGRIRVESGPGRGTAFHMILPERAPHTESTPVVAS